MCLGPNCFAGFTHGLMAVRSCGASFHRHQKRNTFHAIFERHDQQTALPRHPHSGGSPKRCSGPRRQHLLGRLMGMTFFNSRITSPGSSPGYTVCRNQTWLHPKDSSDPERRLCRVLGDWAAFVTAAWRTWPAKTGGRHAVQTFRNPQAVFLMSVSCQPSV